MITEIDLRTIISNSDSRESTPIVRDGYGLVTPLEGSNRPALWQLAFGTNEARQTYCGLVETQDDSLLTLSSSIAQFGLLEPIICRPLGEGKYGLVAGLRRCLAKLYSVAKEGDEPTLEASIREGLDDNDAYILSANENMNRLMPSVIDEAHQIQHLRSEGYSWPQIVKLLPYNRNQTVQSLRNRTELLSLTAEEQMEIHTGQKTASWGRETLKERKKKKLEEETPPPTVPDDDKEEEEESPEAPEEGEKEEKDEAPTGEEPTKGEEPAKPEEADNSDKTRLKTVLERLIAVRKLIDQQEAIILLDLAINELRTIAES